MTARFRDAWSDAKAGLDALEIARRHGLTEHTARQLVKWAKQ